MGVHSRAGRYDGIIVIKRYANSPILIPKLFVLYDFMVIDIIAIITVAEMSQKIMWR